MTLRNTPFGSRAVFPIPRFGTSWGLATSSAFRRLCLFTVAVAIFGHILMTRLRPGWHVTAIGGSRRSAYNTGIPVRRTVARCYVACGALTAVGGIFFAARLSDRRRRYRRWTRNNGADRGGARRHQSRRRQGVGREGVCRNAHRPPHYQRSNHDAVPGGVNRMVLASILILAAVIDVRWVKNRYRIINKVYVSPTYHRLPPAPATAATAARRTPSMTNCAT